MNTEKYDFLKTLMRERILVLDGAMGTMIGCSCRAHEDSLADTLVESHPEVIEKIHEQYLKAGADIIETNSFNANRFSLSDYGLEHKSYELSVKAAEIARKTADKFTRLTPDRPRFVAGSVGPTKHMLSLAGEFDELHFDAFVDAYYTQMRGLLDGGAYIILIETVFDTLNAKAAIAAADRLCLERDEKIPLMVSATASTSAGNLLSGQTLEAFFTSVRHADLLAVGLNCGFGSEQMLPLLRRLSEIADVAVSVHPNAGLPNECGGYDETSEQFAENVRVYLDERLANIIGGCCGTTPGHIRILNRLARRYPPRKIPGRRRMMTLSNLEFSSLDDVKGLLHVGERTNMAGSAKFARLIREKNFEEALEVARKQARAGANMIDVCMDDGLEDAARNMTVFLRMLSGDAETGKLPVMIDSSDWNVVRAALKVCQGKTVVNSISLKEGEEIFLERAREARRFGAAIVVMLFDEMGQAETFERKTEVARRAYDLLVADGFPPEDVIFDPNILTVGTGMPGSEKFALDFIRATEWIKRNLPHVKVSGGISNLSFAYRGNNRLREAMHTVFLHHAVRAGLDMAIVNAQTLRIYNDVEPELRNLLEDLLLCRRADATERLTEYAAGMTAEKNAASGEPAEENLPLGARIERDLIKGMEGEIEKDVSEALTDCSAMDIISGYLMPAMDKIGVLFGDGKMFLPQVIKSAQTMKKAVAVLEPYLDSICQATPGGKVVIATVRGDVHDIGKNIVGLVASCNGFEILDLGVRAEASAICDAAMRENAEAILLSGLISPSLNEMVKVCEELERRNMKTPVIIGGAATSAIHTAVKIAPAYSGPVFYSPDANTNSRILSSLISADRESFISKNREEQEEIRKRYAASFQKKECTEDSEKFGASSVKAAEGSVAEPERLEKIVFNEFPIEKVESYIDWKWFLASLDMLRTGGSDSEERRRQAEAAIADARCILREIKENNLLSLKGVVEIFKARSEGDDIILTENCNSGSEVRLPMLRSLKDGKCVADFIAHDGSFIALFVVTAGFGAEKVVAEYRRNGDDYSAFLIKLVADRLAEAFAQWLNDYVAEEMWGYAKGKKREERNDVRIAFGYPAAPDHSLKREVFAALDAERITGMELTETYMITPSESICGMILPEGEYFSVGRLDAQSLRNYADRRNMNETEIKHLLPNNISL